MSRQYDIIVIGSGPAGMAACKMASEHGADILLLDEQRSPGGQIFRGIELPQNQKRPELGNAYQAGKKLTKAFRKSNVEYVSQATVWQLSPDLEVGYSKAGEARIVSAKQVILATGALERPMPVPGWTLPGVMTAGAAQIMLKESQIDVADAVFAGTGPLLYLIVHQYLAAGIPVKAVIDLTPQGNYLKAARHLPRALPKIKQIIEGWQWKREIANSEIVFIEGATDFRIKGDQSVSGIEYFKGNRWQSLQCEHVFLHQGVAPNLNLSLAAGCNSQWNERQKSWTIETDDWLQSSVTGVAVAGDGASIGGAGAAQQQGAIAALGALCRLGKIEESQLDRLARPYRNELKSEMASRPFLETLFSPADIFRLPRQEDTIVCRCEEITVGEIRKAVAIGCLGPNQLKSFSRCGMGPCQGRMCGLTVSELIADTINEPVAKVGYYRLRSPVKPLLLQELANLKTSAES